MQTLNLVRDEILLLLPADRHSGDAVQDRINYSFIITTPLLLVCNLALEIDGAVSSPGLKLMASVNDLLHLSGD